MNFRLEDWTILKKIFVNINEIIDEIVIECNPEGLKFNALDRSHICFFECNIPKKSFDEYYIDKILYLYIDVNELVKVLKRGNNKDVLVFEADSSTYDITFENTNVRKFSLTQIDMTDNSKQFPNMQFSVNYECDFDSILNSLKDADLYSDKLTFTCKEEELILSCEGSFGRYKNKFPLNNMVGEECSASYSVQYLFKIFNSKLSSDNLIISMGENYPLLVKIEMGFIKLNYLLAPRIENN